MLRDQKVISIAIVLVGLGMQQMSSAAAPKAKKPKKPDIRSTIVVDGIHCVFCARKIAKRLDAVTGVASSKVDAKKGLAIVTPKNPRQLPSPHSLWEAVEKAGYKPKKLTSPSGTFTAKPKAKPTKGKAGQVASKLTNGRLLKK